LANGTWYKRLEAAEPRVDGAGDRRHVRSREAGPVPQANGFSEGLGEGRGLLLLVRGGENHATLERDIFKNEGSGNREGETFGKGATGVR
jgi:hypothetical protein